MSMVSHRLGFTLIELLISVTILLLLFGAGVASYIHFNDNQTVIATGQQIQLMLRTAQKKARVGDKPTGCTILQGYQLVSSGAMGAVVQLQAICTNNTYASDSYIMPTTIFLQSSLQMTFKVLTGGTDQPGTVIVQGPTGTTYTFLVGAGGDISEGVAVTK